VLVLTDSMSLTRNSMKDWDAIYVNLLRKEFPSIEFVHLAIGKATIKTLEHQVLNYYIHLNPSVVILQCGIVDCAPRALYELEQKLLRRLGLVYLVKPYASFLRKHRRIFKTSEEEFRLSILEIKRALPVPLITIGLSTPTLEHEKIVPGLTSQVKRFNEVLRLNSIFVCMGNLPERCLSDDFYHYNEDGHKYVAEMLSQQLKRYVI